MATTTTSDVETLKLIQDTAVKAAGGANRIVKLPDEPAGVYGIVKPDGSIERKFATRRARQHRLLSVGEIKRTIDHYAELNKDRENAPPAISPVVFYCPDLVRVILDDASMLPVLDSVVVPLGEFHTEQWIEVCALEGKSYGQKQFIQLLRQSLWDCIGEAGQSLVKQVRALDWSMGSHTQSKIEKGRSSYGADIEAEVRSQHGGELPDDLTLSVRIYNDPALQARRTVRCALEADPVSHTFTLCPYAGEIDQAVNDEMEHIHSILEAELECPILYGKAGD